MAFWKKPKRRRRPAPGGPEPEESSVEIDQPPVNEVPSEIGQALAESCQFHAPAVVISPEQFATFQGRYQSMGDDRLVVEIFSKQQYLPFKPLSFCFISFAHQTRIGVFIARVLRSDYKDERHLLVVEPPTEVCAVEARKSFRVTVPPGSGLKIAARVAPTETVMLRGIDLSLAGAQVAFKKEHAREFRVGAAMEVALQHKGVRVDTFAEVKRVVGNQAGLFFPKFLDADGNLAPSDKMITILRNIEQIWLKRKKLDEQAAAEKAAKGKD